MSLTAERPPQELLDALSADAAWKRVQMLEAEIKRLRAVLGSANQSFQDQCNRRAKLEQGVRDIIGKHPAIDRELAFALLELVDG